MPAVALLWESVGPYHAARLAGVQATAPTDCRVVGLQVTATDEYRWDQSRAPADLITICAGGQLHESSPGKAAAVYRCLSRLQPDVVVVNGWGTDAALGGWLWALSRHRPVVVMSETTAEDRDRHPWREWLKAQLLRKAGAALVGGERHVRYLRELGFPAERVRTGYDVVDNAHFAGIAAQVRRDPRPAIRSRFRLPEKYFMACARLLARKNIDGLITAHAQYAQQSAEPWGLVVVGAGPEDATLRQHAATAGAEVLFVGHQDYDATAALYGAASAFVHPARREAWGLVVNEAAAAGLPLLVATQVTAGDSLVVEGVSGYRFDAEDPAQLAALMCKLAAMTDQARIAMGEAARAQVATLSPTHFGEALWDCVRIANGRAA
jgi:1,2-diacylglycerol 3-alpha-glucosyltransferase